MSRERSPDSIPLVLPGIEINHSESHRSKHRKTPPSHENALSMLRRVQLMEEQIALLKGQLQIAETALEDQRVLTQRIASQSSDDKTLWNAEKTKLMEDNRELKARVDLLTKVVKQNGLDGAVSLATARIVSPARNQLFQLPEVATPGRIPSSAIGSRRKI